MTPKNQIKIHLEISLIHLLSNLQIISIKKAKTCHLKLILKCLEVDFGQKSHKM